MPDCIICKLIQGALPASIVYEDETVLAFMDLRQPTPGHVLVVSREHRESIFDLEPDLACRLFTVTTEVARAVEQAFHPDGLNVWQSNGAAAGQEIFHFHFHVFARTQGDQMFHVYNYPPPPTDRPALDHYAKVVRAALKTSSL